MDCGADKNQAAQGILPVTLPSFTGHLELVKYLVEPSADMDNTEGRLTALLAACHSGHPEVVKYLQADGHRCIGRACPCSHPGHWKVVCLYLMAGSRSILLARLMTSL